jgi:cytochrome c-type biogenesis protein CcmE
MKKINLFQAKNQLIILIIISTFLLIIFAIFSASNAFSYYLTPEEFTQKKHSLERRIRVGGRVVGNSIKYNDLGITTFQIFGEKKVIISVEHEGMLPSLFGPKTFVIAEGFAIDKNNIRSKSVIVKHENEFLTDIEDADIYVPDYPR